MLNGPAMRAEVASQMYLGGMWQRTGTATVDPGTLAGAADRNDGRRGLWLRTLDRLGLGFDS